MSYGRDPGAEARAQRKAERFMARADAARAARSAGYKSPLRRLVERLLPRHEVDDSGARER